ncbi:MAG: Maf family nucleotide pyrophosphatase [Bacteroidales bacterium]|nr:Maf family nucleotide pyrophosphatase [Bacteroidales bacterium]
MNSLVRNLASYEVILASKSPRRQQLLADMGISFTVLTKDTDESFPADLPAAEIASYLSRVKAEAFSASSLPANFLLITADTVVIKDQLPLNKPENRAEAVAMLQTLSGCKHEVITGITIRSNHKLVSFAEISEVTFDVLEKDEIDFYVDRHKPFDKAGSYGIQEWIGVIGIAGISGSFYNVMGLPTHQLYQQLKNF